VFRSICSSALTLVLTAAFLWGGCISCPQFFMFPKAAKNCCKKSGECERPTKNAPVNECRKMPLETQGLMSAHAESAVAILKGETVLAAPVVNARYDTARDDAPQVEHSPPDLTIVHSSFLI